MPLILWWGGMRKHQAKDMMYESCIKIALHSGIELKVGGGLYLLWLACKAGKSAFSCTDTWVFKPQDKSIAYGKLVCCFAIAGMRLIFSRS